MALTPVEIRHMTDRLLDEIAASFEDVWRERADLADKIEQLETDLIRYRELEALLRATLVSAERSAAEMKEQARREADLVLGEAHAEARAVQRQARAENERLVADSRRLKAQLRAALEGIEDVEDSWPETAPAADAEAEAA